MVTPQDIKLVLVQKITFVLRKINKKLLPLELHFLTPIIIIIISLTHACSMNDKNKTHTIKQTK